MPNPLGEFLRARRQITSVDQVGLRRAGDRRRTPGLRREEVAMLAGVSTDYYIRLEQGRERHPSDQVLGALAQVLGLDAEATEHLHELAHPRPAMRKAAERADRVNPNVLRLIESWDEAPAFVVNHLLDVLAQNRLGAALHEGLEHSDNLIRLTFLNPATRAFYLDWEEEALTNVAHLRAAAGTDRDDPSLLELVDELSLASAEFRQMWARHDVRTKIPEFIRIRHHAVGEMTLHFESFAVNSTPGQHLVVGQAESGSPSEHALAMLGTVRSA